jgi:hypothetical protein
MFGGIVTADVTSACLALLWARWIFGSPELAEKARLQADSG